MNELQLQVEALKEKIPPSFGKYINVDEGWYQIVVDCDKELTAIDPDYQILQVKEKFGGLRYYMTPCNDTTEKQRNKMYEVISKYEAKAAQTCEATGQSGVLMKSVRGWLKTLNPEYAASSLHYRNYSIANQPPSDSEWSEGIR
jgi:hypothetical protein